LRLSSLAFGLLLVCLGEVLFSQPLAKALSPSPSKNLRANPPRVLTTIAQIRALSAGEAAQGLPVELHATLTYYKPSRGIIFAQDTTGGVFVASPPNPPQLKAGDRAVIAGTTFSGYAANIKAGQIRFERAGQFPKPVPVGWRDLMRGSVDCRYVSLIGSVRSATFQYPDARSASANNREKPFLLMDIQIDGGSVRVHVEDPERIDPVRLLDSQVKLTGVAGGLFDGKQQPIGAQLWMSSPGDLQIVRPAASNVADLPLTDIGRIMSGYYVNDESRRVHVRGSVTLYERGLEMVLQTPDQKAILVHTDEQSLLRVGQVVDAVGFPYPHEYSEVIGQAAVLPTREIRPVQPVPIRWDDALAGHYPFELVSMEGKVAAEVHERQQDTLVIEAGPHVFSAILPRTIWDRQTDEMPLPDYRPGSTVAITGVCIVHAGGPWNTERWFDLELRSPQDVAVLLAPPWWTVRRLLYLSAGLLMLVIAAFLWAVMLRGKVRNQTEQIRLTMESEAARERRIALLEKERGRVLEAINSMLNLDEVLLMILRLISTQLEDRLCWCELANGTIVGNAGSEGDSVRRGIYSGAGERLGALVVSGAEVYQEQAGEALEMGASLAALAIDNRRLYETLVHRSQFDQLTNAANRFLLESRLDEALVHAERSQTHFALIYIDLDQFKQVNDLYGHRVGDIYLQQVAERFSERLRGMDTLARVGGDEFIALIPVVRSRSEVEEIIHRLKHCFDAPFRIEDYSIRGTASIGIAVYPEDGLTKDDLKRVADTAMYAHKPGAAVL
jgi:diguanylate cyclase (GGDEF)-like protein